MLIPRNHLSLPAPVYRQLIASKVRALRASGRKPKRPPRLIHPITAERDYTDRLEAVIRDLRSMVNRGVIARLERIAEMAGKNMPRLDAWADDLEADFGWVGVEFARKYTQGEIARIAERTGTSVSEWNRKQNAKAIARVLDIDVIADEPWLKDRLGAFVVQNVNLIEDLGTQELAHVQVLAMQGLQQGRGWRDIADDITGHMDTVGENRARVIARDQVGKLNGQLSQLRQLDMGFKGYTWRGVLDDRERDSHLVNEGEHFTWDDPPAETGHPGDDIQCRCWPEADINTIDTD